MLFYAAFKRISVISGRQLTLFTSFLGFTSTRLKAWLLPDLKTIPNNWIRENSLLLSGYGIGFWCTRSLVQILPEPYISAMHLFICFFVMDFVCKNGHSHEKPRESSAAQTKDCWITRSGRRLLYSLL